MKKKVIIYTDGACSGNPGPGGWGVLLEYGGHHKECSGFEAYTTNQRMELTAAAEALAMLKEPCWVDLYSDSAYLINGFNQNWLEKWQRNQWLNAQKKPVENQDLWRRLLELTMRHEVTWHKVKGHSENAGNNKCDELARKAIKENEKKDEK